MLGRRRPAPRGHAVNDVELAITAILEDDTAPRASDDDTPDHVPAIVPTLDQLTDIAPSASGTPPAAQVPDLGAGRRWLEPATPPV